MYSRSWSHSNRILFIQSLPYIQGSFPVVLSLFFSLLCWSRRVTSSASRHFLLDFSANKAPLVSVPRWKASISRLLRRREWLGILGVIRSADRVMMCRDVTRLRLFPISWMISQQQAAVVTIKFFFFLLLRSASQQAIVLLTRFIFLSSLRNCVEI